MNPRLLLALALVAFNFSAPARMVRIWSDAELMQASDLVVIARPVAERDLDESNGLGFQTSFLGVETSFRVSKVLKGTLTTDWIVLHHYREQFQWRIPNGPGFINFMPGSTNEYALYLVNDEAGRYAPVAGQVDAYLSIKSAAVNPPGPRLPPFPQPPTITRPSTDAQVRLKFVWVDSEETNAQDGYGKNAVDGNPGTYWHTQWQGSSPGLPHEIVIELVPPSVITGFTYLPRQDESDHGIIKDYEFYVSDDGWDFGQPVKKGTFEPGREQKTETFAPVKCRYIKLRAISEINGLPWTSAAEIGIVPNGGSAMNPKFLPGMAKPRFKYEATNGQVTITGCTSHPKAVIIPDTIEGLPVTRIGSFAFIDCDDITSLEIPDSVTSFGQYTFSGCACLTNVVIPGSVTNMGQLVFYDCVGLTAAIFSNGATSVGIQMFDSCDKLSSVVIPGSVTRIEDEAFCRCGSLTSLVIPGGVNYIGEEAFANCSSLTNIIIPDGVTNIYDWTFGSCTNLMNVAIPDSVIGIGDFAFGYCSTLAHIAIPDSVTSIGASAFEDCSTLTNIAIPSSVTGIESRPAYLDDSFGSCKELEAITVDANNPAYSSLDGVLFNKNRTELIQFPAGRTGRYTIPDGVTCIGNRAFDGCDKLTGVKIPGTVTSIGGEAFSGCERLDDINIPGSVTTIGIRIFLGDQSLDHFVFPKSVTNLGSQAPPPLLLD